MSEINEFRKSVVRNESNFWVMYETKMLNGICIVFSDYMSSRWNSILENENSKFYLNKLQAGGESRRHWSLFFKQKMQIYQDVAEFC